MNGMLGKPVSAAFSQLGYPQEETSIAGRTVYIWRSAGSAPTPVTGQFAPFSALAPAPYSCELRVFVSGGIIQSWDAYGDNLGCDRLAAQFR